jgi:hypothetical protein
VQMRSLFPQFFLEEDSNSVGYWGAKIPCSSEVHNFVLKFIFRSFKLEDFETVLCANLSEFQARPPDLMLGRKGRIHETAQSFY